MEHYSASQATFGLAPPIFVTVTLLGVKGFTLKLPKSPYDDSPARVIDRDTVALPEVMIEYYNAVMSEVMRPTFDALWQACGHERSFNYNDRGEWFPQY